MKLKVFALSFSALFLLSLTFIPLVFSQELSTGIAISVPIANKNVRDGSIITSSSGEYQTTSTAYDSAIFGVVSDNPGVLIESNNSDTNRNVLREGRAYVRVSTINGSIQKNDLITSSSLDSIGQKATVNGYVLGSALEDYVNPNSQAVGKILVLINPHYNSFIGSTNVIKLFAPVLPFDIMRYVLPGIVIILSIIIFFTHLRKISQEVQETLAKNRLAIKSIQEYALFNYLISGTVFLANLYIGYTMLNTSTFDVIRGIISSLLALLAIIIGFDYLARSWKNALLKIVNDNTISLDFEYRKNFTTNTVILLSMTIASYIILTF